MGNFVADTVLIVVAQETAVGNLHGELVGGAGNNVAAVVANLLVERNESRHTGGMSQ